MEPPIASLSSHQENLLTNVSLYRQNEIMLGFGSYEWDLATDRGTWSAGLYYLHGKDPNKYRDTPLTYALTLTWIDPRDLPAVHAILSNMEKPGIFESLYRPVTDDGAERWLRTKNMPIFDALGKMVKLIGTAIDVTKEQQALQKLSTKEALLQESEQQLHYGGWSWDLLTDEVHWSAGLWSLLDYPPVERTARVTVDFFMQHIHPDDLDDGKEQEQRIRAADEADPGDVVQRLITRTGRVIWIKTHSRVLEWAADGKPAQMVGSVADISSLIKIQQELERKVLELNRSNHELEQFAYIASHDLQEPLRKITAFGGRLQKKYQATLEGDGLMYLERMFNAARRMQELIDDLLNFSRIGRREDVFHRTDLTETLDSVQTDLEVVLLEKAGRIERQPLPVIAAIPAQMHQLLLNLLHNALKFSRPGVPPIIQILSRSLTAEEKQGYRLPASRNFVHITVADNGLGFEPQYAGKIFAIFQRLHGRSQYEGSGIGLAICKKIVEHHGGFITAEGRPGAGATFVIVLPETAA